MKKFVEERVYTEAVFILIMQVSRQDFETKNITKTTQGGWDKCDGTFTAEQAQLYGIDTWECHGKCYTRRDPNQSECRGHVVLNFTCTMKVELPKMIPRLNLDS